MIATIKMKISLFIPRNIVGNSNLKIMTIPILKINLRNII